MFGQAQISLAQLDQQLACDVLLIPVTILRRPEEGGEDDGQELAHIVSDECEKVVAVEVEERPLGHLHATTTSDETTQQSDAEDQQVNTNTH